MQILDKNFFIRVITGVRLVKNDGVLSIQIQEGYLEENGKINEASLEWKNAEVKKSNDKINAVKLDFLVNQVHLDDFVAKPGYLLTGLKFDLMNDHPNPITNHKALKLAIQTTKYNYSSGELIKDSSYWLRTSVSSNER